MKIYKKPACIALAICLLLSLSACGESGSVKTLETIGTKKYGMAFRHGDRIAQTVSEAANALNASGKLSELSLRWLGIDVISYEEPTFASAPEPEISPEPETEASQETAEASPEALPERVLIVGVPIGARPLAYSENGEEKGLFVDFAKELGTALGWEIKILAIESAQLETHLGSGNIDCAIGFGIEHLSASRLTLGPVLIKSEIVLVTLQDGGAKNIRALEAQIIGTSGDMSVLTALGATDKITKRTENFVAYPGAAQTVRALFDGEAAAIAIDRLLLECSLLPSS